MAWVRFDDGFFRHPKVVAAGRDARDMYTSSIFYANQNLTDGFVPEGALRIIAADAGVSSHSKAVKALLREGLWLETDGGYQIHDYLDYQVSAASVTEKQTANRRRQQDWRDKNRNAQSNGGSNAKSNAVTNTPVTGTDKDKYKNNVISDEITPTPKPPKAKPAKSEPVVDTAPNGSAGGDPPFALFESMCEQSGMDVAEVPTPDKNRNLAVAKRMAESGTTAKDVASITRWLKSQEWRTGGVDMFIVEKERTRWISAGRPDGSKPQQPRRKPPANLQTDSYRGNDEAHWLGEYAEQPRSKTA